MKKKVKNLIEEFKKFIAKGNVLDLAVAVIIGTAFSKIVTSLVNDMVMPLVTAAIGGQSLADLSWIIKPEIAADGVVLQPALTIKWGSFLQNIIDFLIIAIIVFSFVKMLAAAKAASEKLHTEAKGLIKEYGIIKIDSKAENKENEQVPEQIAENIKEDTAIAESSQLGKIEILLEDIKRILKEKTN